MVDGRWDLLDAARSRLVEAFAGDGVRRVEYVAAVADQSELAVWLGTTSDREAARLRRMPALSQRVGGVLREAGLGESDLPRLTIVVTSQETVDRDYDGSWFYALR